MVLVQVSHFGIVRREYEGKVMHVILPLNDKCAYLKLAPPSPQIVSSRYAGWIRLYESSTQSSGATRDSH